jgi:6-phosphogluconolactonase
MKLRFLAYGPLALLWLALVGCSSVNTSNTASGTGLLFVAAQGALTVQGYTIGLANGSLDAIASPVATGSTPQAMAITPNLGTLFVANESANSISTYEVNTDGSLTAVSGATPTGSNPMALAMDPGGRFLFVANQGSNNVSVFSISGTTLTQVNGSPFTTIAPGTFPATGPTALVVPPTGNFLYVANNFTNSVSVFSFDGSSGVLTPAAGSPYTVGLNPSGLAVSPAGTFLLVSNTGSNNVDSFAICVAVSASCTQADGTMTLVSGSPFPAGIGPTDIVFEPNFNFVYVLNRQSSQISQYSFSAGNGVLTALSPAAVSTGLNPVSIVIRSGQTGTAVGNTTTNPTDYCYVANLGGSSISAFTLATSTGLMSVLGSPYVLSGQPSALLAK